MMTSVICSFAGGFAAALLSVATALADPQKLLPVAQVQNGDLTGLVLITEDKDWQAKWNTPVSNLPSFGQSDGLTKGEMGTLLIFFSGLKVANGRLQALCSIDIHKSDGTTQKAPEQICYDEPSLGQRKNVILANARVEIAVEPNDPTGLLRFVVGLRDANSSAKVSAEVGVNVDPSKENGR